MNSLDGMDFCTTCNQYVPEGKSCSDPDCPIVDINGDNTYYNESAYDPEPIDFRMDDLRDEDFQDMYPSEDDDYMEDYRQEPWWDDSVGDGDVERG